MDRPDAATIGHHGPFLPLAPVGHLIHPPRTHWKAIPSPCPPHPLHLSLPHPPLLHPRRPPPPPSISSSSTPPPTCKPPPPLVRPCPAPHTAPPDGRGAGRGRIPPALCAPPPCAANPWAVGVHMCGKGSGGRQWQSHSVRRGLWPCAANPWAVGCVGYEGEGGVKEGRCALVTGTKGCLLHLGHGEGCSPNSTHSLREGTAPATRGQSVPPFAIVCTLRHHA